MNYHWNWAIFNETAPDGTGTYLHSLIAGLGWTIATALSAWCIALVIGTAVGILKTTASRPARRLAFGYIELFRNIPLLVQMFVWYFVVPEMVPHATGLWLKGLSDGSFVAAVVCLGLFTSARIAVQVSAGIDSLPRGQRAAGNALGMREWQVYRYILLPVAGRRILPPLTNEFLSNIKNTSVALTIGLVELTASARSMAEFSFQVFEAFTAATIIYLVVNLFAIGLMKAVEVAAAPGRAPRSGFFLGAKRHV
ncbi:amino acid ABC transporter permease [Paraburkholderia sp. J12]|uniref:amino acid ABC transporter permease n=1 Tax=Paraburkholderia sp. J12 TaxID=2805432 RepID=UPI002ABDA8DA|nr:amino acid ABC transporter permease [Paraburkholderia sp. J12]